MAESYLRYGVVRVANNKDDQKTPAQINTAHVTSVTQEDLQEFVLSQIKRIIWGGDPGNWYTPFEGLGVKPLNQLTTGADNEKFGISLLGPINGTNLVFTTPDKFVNVAGGRTIRVYWNGVRQKALDDYTLSESGGPLTGYDTVTMLAAPRSGDHLISDYSKV